MRLKLIEAGFETYSDYLGGVPFENGISTRDVLPLEADRIGAMMRVQSIEGVQVGASQRVLDWKQSTVESIEEPVTEVAVQVPAVVHTEASLGQVADVEGIKGLRELAAPLGVKGNSIPGLIKAILDEQTKRYGKI